MHQETMLYMWHQLPYEHKRAPADVSADDGGDDSPSREGRGAGRPRNARRTPGRDSIRLGQRVPRSRRRRACIRDRHPQRDERAVRGFRRRRGLPPIGMVDARGLRLGSSRGHRASAVLDAPQRSVEVAWRCSRRSTCRRPGRFTSARWRQRRTPAGRTHVCRRKPSTTARPSANPAGAGTAIPLGRCGAGSVSRPLRFRVVESRGCRTIPRGPKRLGRARPDGKRMGVDVHRLRSVRRIPADGFVSGVLSGLFRRPASGDERRVASDRGCAAATAVFGTGSARITHTCMPPSAA